MVQLLLDDDPTIDVHVREDEDAAGTLTWCACCCVGGADKTARNHEALRQATKRQHDAVVMFLTNV